MTVSTVAFTAYPCADVPATRAWYERHLGLRFAGPYVEDGVERYDEAQLGATCFALMWDRWTDGASGSGNGVAFEVDDLGAAIAELRAAGIACDAPFESPACRSTALRDPEGNRIVLHETAASRRAAQTRSL